MTDYGQQPPGYQPHSVQSYPEQSQATMVLILGILGLVACALVAPFAWVMGNRELEAIDAGRRPPGDRQMANIGKILGIVGTALMALGLVAALFFMLVAIGTAASA